LVEGLDDPDEHVVVGAGGVQREVEVFREPARRAEDGLAQARAALEGEVRGDARVVEHAQGVRQNHVARQRTPTSARFSL